MKSSIPTDYKTSNRRTIFGMKVDVYFYLKCKQTLRRSLQYFLKPFVVSSIGCTVAAIALTFNSNICKRMRSENQERKRIGCPDNVREVIHNNILGKAMSTSAMFNYSTLDNQKQLTDFMINNMYAPHNHTNQEGKFKFCPTE